MKKNQIKNIIIMIVIALFINVVSTYATNYLFNSNEVSYNNNSSGIESDNVQGAIDKLYAEATNYNTLSAKVGSDTLTTTAQNLSGAVNELNLDKSNKIHRATYNWTMNGNLLLDLGADWSNNYYYISGYAISNTNALITAIVTCQQNRYIRVLGMTNAGGNGQSWGLTYYYIEKNQVQ